MARAPGSAIWIPPGTTHAVRSSGPVGAMPSRCCTVAVTPLLRELTIRVCRSPLDHIETDVDAHLAGLLVA